MTPDSGPKSEAKPDPVDTALSQVSLLPLEQRFFWLRFARPFLAVLFFTVFVPGFWAYLGNVFDREGLKSQLPTDAAKKLDDFDAEHNRLELLLTTTDASVEHCNADDGKPGALVERREFITRRLQDPPPITLKPFRLNSLNFFWWPFWYLLAIAMARLAVPPSETTRHTWSRTIGWGVVIWVSTSLVHWIRQALPFGDAKVYTFVNARIDPPSFVYQEFEQLGLSMLIAFTLARWADYKTERVVRDPDLIIWAAQVGVKLSVEMGRWQVASLLLGAFFGSAVAFYASNIVASGDQFYYPTAIMFELVGLITWYVVSHPLREAWREWAALRIKVLVETARTKPSEVESTLKLVDSLRPASIVSTILSAIAVTIGFALPLVNLLLKK